MDQSSLYYFFSTVAQTLAAIAALLAIFAQFKITEITTYLIGDGEATLKRMEKKDPGYIMPSAEDEKKYIDRLRDAIGRKSILGIFEVINILSIHEVQQEKEQARPRGLLFLKTRFEKKINQTTKIKSLTKKTIITGFLAIIISIISLVFVQYLKNNSFIAWITIAIVFTFVSMSIIFTMRGIMAGLKNTDEV